MVNSKFRSQLLETRLEARDAQLQLAADTADLGFWSWEPATGDLSWSPRCQSLLNVGVDTPPSFDSLLARIHPDDQSRMRRAFAQALQQKREFSIEFRLAGSDTARQISCSGRPHASVFDRNQPALSGVMREIRTASASASELLASRVGSMAYRMESLRELERATLIGRIKSEVSQSLGILKDRIATLANSAQLAPAVHAELAELAREAETGLEAVRCAIFEMQPPGVGELGFAGAIERYATEQAAAAGLTLSISVPQEALPLNAPTLESLYVVARTGIDNVVRHARAKQLSVSIIRDHSEITLKVVDDGVGIAEKDLMKDSAYSLFASSERLANWGGALRVSGTPNLGTTLEATIPLQISSKSMRHNLSPLRVA